MKLDKAVYSTPMATHLLLVCDDAGYASVDRGIVSLVGRTGLPVCAEYLITQPGAAGRARIMAGNPLVSIGLHFELEGMSDADRVRLSRDLKGKGSVLGEQEDIRRKAMIDARHQLELFRDALGANPAHVSTHGDFNVDPSGRVMTWWTDFMNELFEGNVPPMQLSIPHVRHNLYSWNIPETARPPRTPEEFAQELEKHRGCELVEFVMHPGLPEAGDASLDMLFTAEMRVRDLESAADILTSGVIGRCGFEVVTVNTLLSAASRTHPERMTDF